MSSILKPGVHGAGMLPIAAMGSIGQGAANWWAALVSPWAVYQPKGAADFASSLLDLSGNGNHAIDPGGASTPGWDAVNGWTFDGIAQYLATTFVPQNDQSQSMLVQFTNYTTVAQGYLAGMDGGFARDFAIVQRQNLNQVKYRNGNEVIVAGWCAAGNLGISGNQGYRNGVADGGAIAAYAGIPTANPVYIGCLNSGGPGGYAAFRCQAFALCSCTEASDVMAAVAAAMVAL